MNLLKEASALVAKFMALGLIHPPKSETLAKGKDFNPQSYGKEVRKKCEWCGGAWKHIKGCKRPTK